MQITEGEPFELAGRKAYRTPGYPLFLAGIYAAFGHSFRAVALVQAVIGGLTTLALLRLSSRLAGRRAALLGGALHAISPVAVAYVPVLASEPLSAFLVVSALLVLSRDGEADGLRRLTSAAGAGMFLGLLALVRPAGVFFLPGLLLTVALRGESWRHRVTTVGALLTAFCLVLAPWTARNSQAGLDFTPLSTTGGVNLHMGNNDQATVGGYLAEAQDAVPSTDLSEIEQDRRFRDLAIGWIASHPTRYLRLCQVRLARLLGTVPDYWAAYHLWPSAENDADAITLRSSARAGTPLDDRIERRHQRTIAQHIHTLRSIRLVYAPLALLALGFAVFRWRRFLPILLPLASYIGFLSLTFTSGRFRYPAQPLFHLLVGALLAGLFAGVGIRTVRRRVGWWVGTVLFVVVFNVFEANGFTEILYRAPNLMALPDEYERPIPYWVDTHRWYIQDRRAVTLVRVPSQGLRLQHRGAQPTYILFGSPARFHALPVELAPFRIEPGHRYVLQLDGDFEGINMSIWILQYSKSAEHLVSTGLNVHDLPIQFQFVAAPEARYFKYGLRLAEDGEALLRSVRFYELPSR